MFTGIITSRFRLRKQGNHQSDSKKEKDATREYILTLRAERLIWQLFGFQRQELLTPGATKELRRILRYPKLYDEKLNNTRQTYQASLIPKIPFFSHVLLSRLGERNWTDVFLGGWSDGLSGE